MSAETPEPATKLVGIVLPVSYAAAMLATREGLDWATMAEEERDAVRHQVEHVLNDVMPQITRQFIAAFDPDAVVADAWIQRPERQA